MKMPNISDYIRHIITVFLGKGSSLQTIFVNLLVIISDVQPPLRASGLNR